jgi:LAO/AO transport system kinase
MQNTGILRSAQNDVESSDAARMMERLLVGDIRALARGVSLVEDGAPEGAELLAACKKNARRALRVGVTGAPGAGKSTLVDQMIRRLRKEGQTVGVVAVDPSSPYTGGALLGDRIRMQGFEGDPGVYIRSMASRGRMGGVAAAAEDVCVLMDAAGRDVVVIETVGVGQDEVEVAGLADVTVLVLVPGMGDEVQSLKAGVMEAADVYVVNKSDRGGAQLVEAEVRVMQSLSDAKGGWVAPVVRTVATAGEGVDELVEVVKRCAAEKSADRTSNLNKRKENAGPSTRFGTKNSPNSAQDDKTIHRLSKEKSFVRKSAEFRLDHLGVAVRNISTARGFYEALGMVVANEETVEHEKVKTAMLPVGESRIELLEPTEEDSVIGRFLAKRGEGLHHIALRVDGIDAMFARLKAQGVKLASDSVRIGAGGHRYFFVHPASTGGVLVELVEDVHEGKG